MAKVRTQQVGPMQLRVVEYSSGYLGDHWCPKGHVIYVLSGALIIEHEDNTPNCSLDAGTSWYVGEMKTRAIACGRATAQQSSFSIEPQSPQRSMESK